MTGAEKDDKSSVVFLAMMLISVAVILISALCILYVIYLFKKRVDKKGEEDKRARENVYKVGEGDDGGKVEIELEARQDVCPRPPSEYCPRPPSEYSANAERPSLQPKESLNPQDMPVENRVEDNYEPQVLDLRMPKPATPGGFE